MEISVKDLSPGVNYALQARSVGASSSSNWSSTFKFLTISDTTPPDPVTSLTWSVNGTGFVATWVKPLHDSSGLDLKDFNGYQVQLTANSITQTYIVQQPRFDLTFAQNVAMFGTPQPIVGISVRVIDRVGNLSSAVTASATNAIPANITNFTAVGFPLAVSLNWDATVENDFKAYQVYMSTSSSGFTPGPGNLIMTTTSNSFVVPTTNIVVHYYKINQIDIYNQISAVYASASASPLDTTGIDVTAPGAPSAVTVSTTADPNGGTSHIDVSWTASGSSNLAGYVVRYSTDAASWQYINVPSNRTAAKISNLLPATTYYVAVASISFVSTYSAFVNASVGGYPITSAADTGAPSTPSAPTVSIGTSLVQVAHDMTKAAGGALESDVDYLEVHSSTTTGFTPSGTTRFGTIAVSAPGVAVSGNFSYSPTDTTSNVYWKIIAVDFSGNKSTASTQATGMPGLIQGINLANATITNAKVNDLSAAKLTAGTAFINNLSVQSALTLDASTGFIKSTNFSSLAQTGWQLDQNGLVIYNGSIAAKSLVLQNGNNRCLPPFADFEFNSDYYHDTSNVANPLQMSATSTMLLAIQFSGAKTGIQALRVFNTSITSSTTHTLDFAPGGQTATGVNIDVITGDYIYSVWAKKNGAVDQNIKIGLYTDTSVAIASSTIAVTSTTYTRYSAVLTVPIGVAKVKMYMDVTPVTTGYDLLIDDLQLEYKLTADTAPSPWQPPSTTTIDGGAIITGSIRSSAASATVVGQPAWSINTAGNMQIGDALIRGRLIVGVANESKNLLPKTYNSWEDAAATYYNVSTNVPNSAAIGLAGTTTNLRMAIQTTGSPPQGLNAMRFFGTGFTSSLLMDVFFAPAAGDNITTVPGQRYIISMWIKSNDVTKSPQLGFGLHNYTTTTYVNAYPATVPTATWTRVSGVAVAPSNIESLYISLQVGASDTAFDISIDGLMVELAPDGATTTPSTYEAAGTGSSSVQSTNYVAGSKGWVINSDGSVEFNSATLRGNLNVTGTQGSLATDLSSGYPTLYYYNATKANFSYLNLVNVSAGDAVLGINSGSFTSTLTGTPTLRPRLYFAGSIGGNGQWANVDSLQRAIGGQILLGDTGVVMSNLDTSSVINSYISVNPANITITGPGGVNITGAAGTTATALSGTGGAGSKLLLSGTNAYLLSMTTAGVTTAQITPQGASVFLQGGNGSTLNGPILAMAADATFSKSGVTPIVKFNATTGFLDTGTPWSNLSLQNGFSAKAGYIVPQVRLNALGQVEFRGTMTKGTPAADNTWIFSIPTAYLPSASVVMHPSLAPSGAGSAGSARIYLNRAGAPPEAMYAYGMNAGGTTDVCLDNCFFSIS